MPDILLARREQADVRSAIGEAIADRLSLGGDDIGAHFTGRLDRAEADDLGDDGNQEGARRVGSFGDRCEIAHITEEVGVLDNDARGFIIDCCNNVFCRHRTCRQLSNDGSVVF